MSVNSTLPRLARIRNARSGIGHKVAQMLQEISRV
jgi:hypothetical protein